MCIALRKTRVSVLTTKARWTLRLKSESEKVRSTGVIVFVDEYT